MGKKDKAGRRISAEVFLEILCDDREK